MKRTKNPGELNLLRTLLAEFVNSGRVDLSKSKDEIWEQFRKAGRELEKLDPVVDHTSDLLAHARQAKKSDDYPLAVLMYATWVEHMLNMALFELAASRGMKQPHITSMVKEASLRAKSTWLLPVLGGKQLSKQSINRIQKLADARNAYIHYKWGQPGSEARSDQVRALAEAEKLVKTLQRYKPNEIKLLSSQSKIIRELLPKQI